MFYTSQHRDFFFRRDVNISSVMGENSDRMTHFGCVMINFTFPPPPPIRLWNNLKILLIGSQFSILCHNRSPITKYEIAPKSGKNNRNFLRSTLITPRATSYLPLCTIKNQDDLLRQGKQLHTNCIMKVSKVNFDDKIKHDCVFF